MKSFFGHGRKTVFRLAWWRIWCTHAMLMSDRGHTDCMCDCTAM